MHWPLMQVCSMTLASREERLHPATHVQHCSRVSTILVTQAAISARVILKSSDRARAVGRFVTVAVLKGLAELSSR